MDSYWSSVGVIKTEFHLQTKFWGAFESLLGDALKPRLAHLVELIKWVKFHISSSDVQHIEWLSLVGV
jgi:hypothetical protein